MGLPTKDNIQPFAPDIFTLPPDNETQPVLLGGFCPECRDYFFPAPRFCPECLGRIEKKEVGSKGKIYSFTVVRTPPPFGLPSPYGIGYITLRQTGLRVLGLFDPEDIDELKINANVVLSVKPLGCDKNGLPQLRPCFALETDKE
jgi:uncharacterized OB-fold protein